MSLKRTAILSAFWAVGESWAMRAISAVVFLILARLVDPAAFGLAFIVMTIASLAACFLPAWRATRTDPVRALRD